jgi:hypothetical protein
MPDNSEQRECPLCGGSMYLKETETVSQIPGNPEPTRRTHWEWICPDCDNFEEADDR